MDQHTDKNARLNRLVPPPGPLARIALPAPALLFASLSVLSWDPLVLVQVRLILRNQYDKKEKK